MPELELTFSAGKTRSLESIFFAKQGRITRTSFVYKTSPLVRISLLISALNNRVMLFLSGNSYFIKVIENFFFPVFAYPDINTRGVGRIIDLYHRLEFSQPITCLYLAMQTRKTFSFA